MLEEGRIGGRKNGMKVVVGGPARTKKTFFCLWEFVRRDFLFPSLPFFGGVTGESSLSGVSSPICAARQA